MMSISTKLFGEISHASLFFTGQLRNPWQMLAEPRLKITALKSNLGLIKKSQSISREVIGLYS